MEDCTARCKGVLCWLLAGSSLAYQYYLQVLHSADEWVGTVERFQSCGDAIFLPEPIPMPVTLLAGCGGASVLRISRSMYELARAAGPKKFLETLSFLNHLSEKDLEKLARKIVSRRLRFGETLVDFGEQVQHIHFVRLHQLS